MVYVIVVDGPFYRDIQIKHKEFFGKSKSDKFNSILKIYFYSNSKDSPMFYMNWNFMLVLYWFVIDKL